MGTHVGAPATCGPAKGATPGWVAAHYGYTAGAVAEYNRVHANYLTVCPSTSTTNLDDAHNAALHGTLGWLARTAWRDVPGRPTHDRQYGAAAVQLLQALATANLRCAGAAPLPLGDAGRMAEHLDLGFRAAVDAVAAAATALVAAYPERG